MSGKILSECMNEIGDDLIADAVEYRSQKKLHIWPRVVAAAAVLALLMTMLLPESDKNTVLEQNTLKVYACNIGGEENAKPEEETLLNGVSTSPWYCFCDSFLSANTYLPFTLSFPNDYFPGEEITFDIYSDYADLWCYVQDDDSDVPTGLNSLHFGKYATVANNHTILWTCDNADQLEESVGDQGCFYINIIIRANERIVGYGVIGLELSVEPIRTAKVVQCETVSFPLVAGEKQSVSDEYVWGQIEQLKRKKI